MTRCVALILAGGAGMRFGGEGPKQYRPLGGVPLLRRTVEAFLFHPAVDAVRAVIREEDRSHYDRAVAGLDLLEPAIGGADRQESGRLGLESLVDIAPAFVLIHDAARPFVPPHLIDNVLAALERAPAAVPALPVVDTLKRTDAAGGAVAETVDRGGLRRAQTPQGFAFAEILAAHRAAAGLALSDDAAIAERAGLTVALVEGDEDNVKVTTMEDLERAQRLLNDAATELRVGAGFDTHRFTGGDAVMLCGVPVPHDRALEGHSDADVGLHALTDAVLGAIAEGDIGAHFPPSDERWRGTASDAFLAQAAGMVRARGGRIVNLDVTLVCEAPRIGPYRDAMRARIAAIAGIELSRISVKATTADGMGFTGRREGIAAHAVATVALPQRKSGVPRPL